MNDDRGLTPTAAVYMLIGFLGFVAFLPTWIYWVDNYTAGLGYESTFLASFILPATLILFIAGWLEASR